MPEALPAVTVPALRTIGLSLARPSSVVSGRGCSSLSTVTGPALPPGTSTGDDLLGEIARRHRLAGALLRAQREGVLVGARDLVLLGHVLAGLRHRVDAVLRLHQRIDEAPAERGVMDFGAALERLLRLAHDQRRARHRFDAAGDGKLGLAAADGARGIADGVEAGGAQPVDGQAGNASRGCPPAAAPCARRCGCPRRPGWRSRTRPRRAPTSRLWGCA